MRLLDLLFQIVNPFVIWLLRSQFHGLVSGSLMLVTYTGRRSMRRYTTPVQYYREGAGDEWVLLVFSFRHRVWWRSLRGDRLVTALVRGEDMELTGEVIETDDDAVAEALRTRYGASPEKAARMARTRVLVCFRPLRQQRAHDRLAPPL